MAITGICSSPQHIAHIPTITLSSLPTIQSMRTSQYSPPQLNSPASSSSSTSLGVNLVSNDALEFVAAAEAVALASAAALAARDAASAAAGMELDWPCNNSGIMTFRNESIESEARKRRRKRRSRRRKAIGYVEVEETCDVVKHGMSIGSVKSRKLSPAEEAKICLHLKEESRLIETQRTLSKSQAAASMSKQLALAMNMEQRNIDSVRCNGRESRALLTRNYKRLIVSIATKFQGKGLSLEDLIQEGCMGLIRGAEKFDPERGHKLSSYVYWWIKQAIMSAIDKNSRLVRLPGNMCQMIPKVAEARTTLSRMLHRSPTNSEIAEALHVDVSVVRFVSMKCISLNKPVAVDQGQLTLQEILSGPEEWVPEEMVKRQLLRKEVEGLLNMLDKRQAEVLRLRFGLNGKAPLTYEEIGRILKISRETVRQTNVMALEKLQKTANVDIIKYYIV